jgi:hypothetical protein
MTMVLEPGKWRRYTSPMMLASQLSPSFVQFCCHLAHTILVGELLKGTSLGYGINLGSVADNGQAGW